MIKDVAKTLASEYGVDFYYQDFREGFNLTFQLCRDTGLYRQPYCGCIFSEKERYYRKLVKE
jgi:epoxyqueuosine reductase